MLTKIATSPHPIFHRENFRDSFVMNAVPVEQLFSSDVAISVDPQLNSLNCLFCNSVLKSASSIAMHFRRIHGERLDFPVLLRGRFEDAVGSATVAKLVLKEIDFLLFNRMKMRSVQRRMITGFKKISLFVICPQGAFDSMVQSF